MAEGELKASENLSKAAERLASTKGALHLRTLQTLSDVSADQSNTIVVLLPIEVMRAIEGFTASKDESAKKK